jgi:hypothetical protein
MCLGCSRVRESPCRVAGLAFRTKRTTASEPANNGPRSEPTLPTDQAQTTHELTHNKSPVEATAGGLCPPGCPLGPPRFIALTPIPEKHQQKRDAVLFKQGAPVSGLGPWRGARVASPRGPVLRPGHWPCYPRSACGTTVGARPPWSSALPFCVTPAQPRASQDERNQRHPGRVPGRTESFAFVIRDPGRSFFDGWSIFWSPAVPTTDWGDARPAPPRRLRDQSFLTKKIENIGNALDTTISFREVPPNPFKEERR